MIFRTTEFIAEEIDDKDVEEIVEVYNSNTNFLEAHLGRKAITSDWVRQELESMKNIGFSSCKIIDRNSFKIAGIIDYQTGNETYLSLLMIRYDCKGKGMGTRIFQAFEEYVKSLGGNCIRIDVVTGYDPSVLGFWKKNGFEKYETIELNWTGKRLPAVTMKKCLN